MNLYFSFYLIDLRSENVLPRDGFQRKNSAIGIDHTYGN